MDIQGALHQEELRLTQELEKVRNAIDALRGRGNRPGRGRETRSRTTAARTDDAARRTARRPLSPAARRRIAQAQRRRWAKVKAEKQAS